MKIRVNKGTFEVGMTTPMMNFMLHFNKHMILSLGKFCKMTNIEFVVMKKHVYALIKGGLLTVNVPIESVADLTEDTVLSLNLKFEATEFTKIALLNE